MGPNRRRDRKQDARQTLFDLGNVNALTATLRLQKISNLMQDPFERADITSNTFWDWQINHVGSAYGWIEVFQFADTFKEFPPRSFPPSFNPANIL